MADKMKERVSSIMRVSVKALVCAAALAGLSACGASWDDDVKIERGLTAPDHAFHDGLQYEYAYFSVEEKSDVDKKSPDWFEGRGMDAAGNDRFLPEEVSNRDIPESMVTLFTSIRERLVIALDKGGRVKHPYIAAHAQAMFDCWIEEQEENQQPIDISVCRNELMRALDILDPVQEVADAAPPPPPPPPPAQPEILAGPFFVYFEHDSDVVDATANEPLQQTLAAHGTFPQATVFVRGHTDLTGALDYNLKLSQRRSINVTHALQGKGVPADLIRIEAYGEDRPKVPTGETDRLRTNRRVEIWLSGR